MHIITKIKKERRTVATAGPIITPDAAGRALWLMILGYFFECAALIRLAGVIKLEIQIKLFFLSNAQSINVSDLSKKQQFEIKCNYFN